MYTFFKQYMYRMIQTEEAKRIYKYILCIIEKNNRRLWSSFV